MITDAGVYDGTFAGRRLAGDGVTTEMLKADGVRVFSEKQIDEAAAFPVSLESTP